MMAAKQVTALINQALLPKFKADNPVSLTGSITLNPGESKVVNVDALRNLGKQPIAIHEIKFVASTLTAVTPIAFFAPSELELALGPGGKAPPATAAALEASIRVGDLAVTRAPVPVNLLGPRRCSFMESLGSTGTMEASATAQFTFGLIHHVWRLDSPIILKGGQFLEVTLGHRNFFSYGLTAYVVASGRVLPTMPKTMHLPYVASFTPASFDATARIIKTSTERDLVNDLGVPLNVKRFTGRVTTTMSAGAGALTEVNAGLNSSALTLKMRSFSGVKTVQHATPFENVFDVMTAAWECPHTLPPGGYWIAELTHAGLQNTKAHAAIALHGTREVAV
jgi:hypothetical protein